MLSPYENPVSSFCVFLCCDWLNCVPLLGVINKIFRLYIHVLLMFFLFLVACRERVSTNVRMIIREIHSSRVFAWFYDRSPNRKKQS